MVTKHLDATLGRRRTPYSAPQAAVRFCGPWGLGRARTGSVTGCTQRLPRAVENRLPVVRKTAAKADQFEVNEQFVVVATQVRSEELRISSHEESEGLCQQCGISIAEEGDCQYLVDLQLAPLRGRDAS